MNHYLYKISVIMPVYQVKEYIELSVASICQQDFQDFELLLVDDGSPDNSIELAGNVLKQYPDVCFRVISQENKGLPAARNAGLREANGEYISYIDSDDIVTPDYLSSLYQACQKHRTQAAFTEYEVVHMKQRKGKCHEDAGTIVLSREELLMKNMLRSVKIHLCAMLISHDFIRQNQLYFNENLRYGEEVDYTWRMFPLLSSISYVQSQKYKYLVRSGSLMTAQKAERVELLMHTMHDNIKKWFLQHPEDAKKFKWVESKIYMEKMHAFAQNSSYQTFQKLLSATAYQERTAKLKDFPDKKIRILSSVLSAFPFCYWAFFRITKF